MTGGKRHQAGFCCFLDGATGKLKLNSAGEMTGEGWHSSHNFDQRGFFNADNGFYTLAHGDSYPRALMAATWDPNQRKALSKLEYFKYSGSTGDPVTNTTTGDFTELSNRDVAVLYSTSEGRTQRDLRLVLLSGMNVNAPAVKKEVWITELANEYVGWGAKIIQYSSTTALLAWNTFSTTSTTNAGTGTHFRLVDLAGEKLYPAYDMKETALYPQQSFRYSNDKKSVFFVSSGTGTLKVYQVKVNDAY
ncbi:MAG: hypothetical protein QM743_03450 [Chitinophagaceae bacterium]